MRSKPSVRADARKEGESVKHEIGEKEAFEKAEKEDEKLHKVVTKAMKKMGKK